MDTLLCIFGGGKIWKHFKLIIKYSFKNWMSLFGSIIKIGSSELGYCKGIYPTSDELIFIILPNKLIQFLNEYLIISLKCFHIFPPPKIHNNVSIHKLLP